MPDKPPSFASLRKPLQALSREALVKLLRELHDLYPDVRTLLHARYGPSTAETEQTVRQRITRMFEIRRPDDAPPSIADARKLALDYEKAAIDPAAGASLLLHVIECADRFAYRTFEPDVRLYRLLASTVAMLEQRLKASPGRELTHVLRPRLEAVSARAGKHGYGWGDEFPAWLEDTLRDLPPPPAPPRRYDGDPDFDDA